MTNKEKLITGGIALGAAVISSGITLLAHSNWCYHTLYKYAADLVSEGKYKDALDQFNKIYNYKNSDKYAKICKEKIALQQIEDMIDEKDYQSANWMFDFVCEQNILSQRDKDYIHAKLLKLSDELDNEFELSRSSFDEFEECTME